MQVDEILRGVFVDDEGGGFVFMLLFLILRFAALFLAGFKYDVAGWNV